MMCVRLEFTHHTLMSTGKTKVKGNDKFTFIIPNNYAITEVVNDHVDFDV